MNAEHDNPSDPRAELKDRIVNRNFAVIAITSALLITAMFATADVLPNGGGLGRDALMASYFYVLISLVLFAPILCKKQLSETLCRAWLPALALFAACYISGAATVVIDLMPINLAAALLIARSALNDIEIPAGCCPKCNYDLRGKVSGICPECGESVEGFQALVSSTTEPFASSRSAQRWLLALPAGVLTLVVTLVGRLLR